MYLENAEKSGKAEMVDHAVKEYGNAIRELAIANNLPWRPPVEELRGYALWSGRVLRL